jgi:hypothetical protein
MLKFLSKIGQNPKVHRTCTTSILGVFLLCKTKIMKAFFEAIAYLFEEILFIPLNMLRELELTSWFFANAFNWLFLGVGFAGMLYWLQQLKKFNANNEEDRDSTSHSFL